jgi:CRP/FNR family cyclic AMP-dependent transcriptional regulator
MGASSRRIGTLSDADLMAVGSHGIARSYPKNTVIVSEGDRTDSLYVILEGRVKVYVSDDDGRDVVLATQGPGEYFGELVLDEGPRSASVMTLEPARFLVVPLKDFREFVVGNPAFALSLIAEESDGTLVISQRLTQQDIASRIGASREMVSRILKDLSTGGYLTQSRTGIVLHRKPPEHW